MEFYQHFRVGIRFNAFDVEGNSRCQYDYLQIRDGPNETSPVLGRFCGGELPGELKGNSSELTIQFASDKDTNKPGFYLNFFSGNTVAWINIVALLPLAIHGATHTR